MNCEFFVNGRENVAVAAPKFDLCCRRQFVAVCHAAPQNLTAAQLSWWFPAGNHLTAWRRPLDQSPDGHRRRWWEWNDDEILFTKISQIKLELFINLRPGRNARARTRPGKIFHKWKKEVITHFLLILFLFHHWRTLHLLWLNYHNRTYKCTLFRLPNHFQSIEYEWVWFVRYYRNADTWSSVQHLPRPPHNISPTIGHQRAVKIKRRILGSDTILLLRNDIDQSCGFEFTAEHSLDFSAFCHYDIYSVHFTAPFLLHTYYITDETKSQ